MASGRSIKPLRTPITTLIFDNNGVLTTSDKERTYRVMGRFLAVPVSCIQEAIAPFVKRLDTGKMGQHAFYRNVLRVLGREDVAVRDLELVHLSGYQRKPRVMAFAQWFKKKYRMALLSNFGEAFWRMNKRWRLERIFQKRNMFVSSDIGLSKPDKRIFLYALKKLRASPYEVVFIDDSTENIRAARGLGMHTVHFRNLPDCRKRLLRILGRSRT